MNCRRNSSVLANKMSRICGASYAEMLLAFFAFVSFPVVSNFEFSDLVQKDRGPRSGQFWVNYNSAGAERTTLLEKLWRSQTAIGASDRFVRLDDNSPKFSDAIASLERLIEETAAVRINDWPEKEGILETLKSSVQMIKSKYVNKTTLLTAVSSVTAYIISKFVDAPITELANRAWEAVKALF